MAYLSPIQFSDSNIAGTTLANVGGIGSGDNTLTLASAATLGCPTSPSFDILIDNEYITVNGISGNVCTPLSRGANGTTPAAHAQNAPVYSPITIGMINAAMARIDQANASGFQSPVFTPSGLTTQVSSTSRIIGAVAPGAGIAWTPAGGPYNVGDIVWDVSNANFYVCTVAGTPGTWKAAPSLSLAQAFSAAITSTATILTTAEITGADLKASGAASLGSPRSGRFVGEWTTAGAPTGLTGQLGDYGFDGSQAMYVCTAAGTPGTWQDVVSLTAGLRRIDAQSVTNVASVTVPPSGVIPSWVRNVHIYMKLRGLRAAVTDTITIRPNNDSGNNYVNQNVQASGSAVTTSANDATPIASFGNVIIPANTAPANSFAFVHFVILDILSSTDHKPVKYESFDREGTGAGSLRWLFGGGLWLNVAAMTTLVVAGTNGNITGRVETYGEP